MTEIIESMIAFIDTHIWTPITHMTWKDGLDILLLAILLYLLYSFVSVRRAGKLLLGLATVVVLYFVTGWLGLRAAHWLLSSVASFGVIVLVVIFQPELRDALDKLGSTVIDMRVGSRNDHVAIINTVDAVVDAACQIAQREKDGALIVIERTTKLGEHLESGVALDARVSSKLLVNIFVDRTPLHDGAVIIRDDRILAAGCKLPMAPGPQQARQTHGTRHMAAVRITELSDCVVVVVSEERHVISVAHNGSLSRPYNNSMADFAANDKDIRNRLRNDLFLAMTGSADPTRKNRKQKASGKKARREISGTTFRVKDTVSGESTPTNDGSSSEGQKGE